jgi:pimeloyl-ACP methyl ester carboxylesterase
MLDLPGHGLSERPDASYELAWYARIVARWLAEMDLDAVDVVGHSFGGGVAQMLLLECPQRVRRLVLVSSGGLGHEVAVALRLAALPQVVERLGQAFMGPGTRIALKATGHNASRDEVARLVALNGQRGTARAFARTVKDVIGLRGQRRSFFDRAHELSSLPPVAVFWGKRDSVIPVTHARQLAHYLDGVHVVEFEQGGHYPHQTEADAFQSALRDFLDAPSMAPARMRASRVHATPEMQLQSA